MSIEIIHKPLPGERVVGLSPETATEAATVWLRRPNLFPGRALTAGALSQRQQWQAGHIAERGQDWVAGIVEGLEVETSLTGASGFAGVKIRVSKGRGLAVSGEDVVLNQQMECLLADVPVVAPTAFFADGSNVGGNGVDGLPFARKIGVSLGELKPVSRATLPAVGVLVLQAVTVDTSSFDPLDPCDRSACDENTIDDNAAFEDWRIGDGVRLLWYVWPGEWNGLPPVSDVQMRNALAWTIFGSEARLSVDAAMPWERFGVPIAMIALDAAGMPTWVDRASVARHGGRARDARLQLAHDLIPNFPLTLAANSRLPSLWQSQIEQFAEQVAATGEPAPAPEILAAAFGRFLPPVGLLPRNAYEPASHKSGFFPAGFDIDAAPIPVEQLDLAIRASASMAPLNLSSAESVRVLVPVPLQSWEPRLLITEVIDAEFQKTLDRFLLTRARQLGARQGLLVRQSVLTRAVSGIASEVPDWRDDEAAVEAESLQPWGPPPVGGGHRSALRTGFHQHYFEQASATMTVTGDRLFVWVYLDPDNTPRTLMLQWHSSGSWEHRAYWGENLIGWGTDGTTSRARIGDLPTAGGWTRLELPADSVALTGAVVDGIAFSLFDGQAAFGATGDATTSATSLIAIERRWFSNVLPAGALQFGDEPWELLASNDLWAPFEATLGVLPASPAELPPTLGGHYDVAADGLHQHFFNISSSGFAIPATESIFCWVYLDPVTPPRQIQLQLRSSTGLVRKAYWGWNLINTGDRTIGTRMGDLPQPGQWTRLEFHADVLFSAAASIIGVAFQQYDGFTSFGAIGAGARGADDLVGTERVRFAELPPAGAALRGTWNFLNATGMQSPSPASDSGQVQALSDLYNHPALQVLSAPERAQIYLRGAQGFVNYLSSRADRADDVVDYGFVKVQTDVYRIRQLMLGSTAATRLAVSPSLANIAQAETATASQTQIASFLSGLRTATPASASPAFASPAFAASADAPSRVTSRSSGGDTGSGGFREAPQQAPVALGGFNANLFSDVLVQNNLRVVSTPKTAAATAFAADIKPIVSIKATTFAPIEIANASPLVGGAFIRTTTVAQRLENPKSKEARDYATASRLEAIQSILRLADTLSSEDGGTVSGLFEGLDMHGLNDDGFLDLLPGETVKPKSRSIAQFINPATRATLLGRMLTVPTRTVLGAQTDPDESAYFSDSTDLSDHIVALMRKMEGRIRLYREAIAVCQQIVADLQLGVTTVRTRLAAIGENLAEARHDVGVVRALFAEETQRIADINARRTRVLAEEVKFLAFIRPREADNLLATPTHAVDPGLLDAPVPACLRAHPDVPDELVDMLRVVREAPSNWFIKAPALLYQLDKVEHLVRTLTVAQNRALAGLSTPVLMQATSNSKLGVAINRVAARQVEALAPRISAMQNFNIAALANLTWHGIRQHAEQVVSFGDLADGGHGRSDVAQAAATELQNIRSISACLHAEFSGITPLLRLEWSETLSEFDEAPNLRNLASLPRWSEIGYIDRRQMQGYVDWLFAQIEPNQPQAVALVNDVIRMCLLLASHAPVDRIVAGRMARPITGVVPGIRIPLIVLEPARLRVGMQAVIYRGESVIARAVVEDLGQLEVSAHVIHTTAAKVDLGDDVRIHFDNAASVSLTQTSAKRTLFGR